MTDTIPHRDEFTTRLRQAMHRGRRRPESATETGATEPQDGGDPAVWEPAGQGETVVRPGDCLSSISADTGHLWQTIWEDCSNTELRERRKDPNVLATGDRLTIPALRPKSEPAQTEMRHRFQRVGQPTVFRLRVCENGQARANQPYTLTIDGEPRTGVTNCEGMILCSIPSGARRGLLQIGEGDEAEDYELDFGCLSPVEHAAGTQQRLKNLGFDCGAVDGAHGSKTQRAIRGFQKKYGVQVTGIADEATRERLREVHGS